LIVRFILIPAGLIDERERTSSTSTEPGCLATIESKPIDPNRLAFIKRLVESGQIHD